MNRREFNYLSAAFFLNGLLPQALAFESGDKTTLSENFAFVKGKNGELVVQAEDFEIDGLSFPKFTWQWIGMGLAVGVLSFIGGQLFGILANAIFSGTHKSMEQLLREQMEAFAQILQDAITENEVRRYGDYARAYFHLYREYSRTPSKEDLRQLKINSYPALSNLESSGFPGYRTYMSAASLRLSILQEARKKGMATIDDFDDQMNESIGHHQDMIAYIDKQTDPSTYFPPGTKPTECFDNQFAGWTCNAPMGPSYSPNDHWHFWAFSLRKNICGHNVGGFIPAKGDPPNFGAFSPDEMAKDKRLVANDSKYLADRLIDLGSLRQTIKAENTDFGEKMVQKWTAALAKMKQGSRTAPKIQD